MPAISKIRFTNVVYENGGKRYNDDIFEFDGYNGAILLENGGGKTVFIQTALQAVLPHVDLAERKIKNTLSLEGSPCHIAIEWILNERPRRYGLTAVTLFLTNNGLDSYKYVYEYGGGDKHSIEELPFVKTTTEGKNRPVSRGEISDYYQQMQQQYIHANLFKTIKEYHRYIEENFHIIPTEWQSIARINSAEGDVDGFFDGCKTTSQLVDQLLIPVVEDAMAGNGTEDFIETFEKHREHFKKHKQLSERIEESKKVSQGIGEYVECFASYHETQKRLVSKKEETKGIYNLVVAEKVHNDSEIENNGKLLDKFREKELEHKRKESSYKLSLLERDMKNAKEEYESIANKYKSIYETLEEKEEYLQNLEIAEVKKSILKKEELISLYENQLENLDKDEQIQDLQEQLKENSGELKGYFIQEEKRLENEKTLLINQKSRYEEDFKKDEERLETLQNEKIVLEKEMEAHERTIILADKDLENISKEILSNSIHEKIEEEYPKWKLRTEEIETQGISYRNHLNQKTEEKKALQQVIPNLYKEIQELKSAEAENRHEWNNINIGHDRLLADLKSVRGDWKFYNSLYEKQATILSTLEEKVEKTRIEKEQLLLEERLSYRLQDDYGDQEYFTTEPMLEEWISRWSQQFHFIESGSAYINKAAKTLGKSIEDLYKEYPLWVQTVITSTVEVEKLYQKLKEQVNKLTHPVLVLSDEEAKEVLNNNTVDEFRYVFPFHWETNANYAKFAEWKDQIKVVAEKATTKRINKEKEYSQWVDLLSQTNTYFYEFPFEIYQELQKDMQEIGDVIKIKERDLQRNEEKLKLLEQEISQTNEKLWQLEQETMLLGHKLQRTQEYFNKKELKKKSIIAKQEINEKIERKDLEIKGNKESINRQRDILENLKWDIQNINQYESNLKDDSLYKVVYRETPILTDKTKSILQTHRQTIIDRLSKKQKGRQEIESLLNSNIQQKDEQSKSLTRLRKKYNKYPIDESFVFPIHGDRDIEQITQQINEFKENINSLKPILEKSEKVYDKSLNIYDLRQKDFYRNFNEIMIFTKGLSEIKLELEQEREDLSEQNIYLENRKKTLYSEGKNIDEAIQLLKAKHERFRYLTDDVRAEVLPQDKQDFSYNRLGIIQVKIDDLEKLDIKVDQQFKKVETQKNIFIQNCNTQVQDIRLREMAVTGAQNKRNYDEILQWQQKMQQRILRTIEVAENAMREHDRQLQQFIQHLHTYLYTLAQEIRTIPRNTRVKIEGGWKEIFYFDVPDWSEQDGKEEIRRYIDQMVSELEGDRFKDEQGKENLGEVKKHIEKSLQSKQLLKHVMKEKMIKVKCRKVTNDGKVIGAPFSWETSNLWSGGEKWSKNMALFLGILNYIAEKRQHIIVSKKLNRTVILDNPFGKASSEHVLEPVFFIAEQLGFQIIALTAHAEGKFISDYFPIVYSCKLRQAVDSQTSIFTKEKIISYAYFQDNDPQTLMRLGEQEQLTLF